jgi:alpha-amylase/alpha-mannosidase (GH57 family)
MTAKAHPMQLCIHGHFYQPPRENPWTGRIELQDSAAPHHDWNVRIQRECYAPNGASRLLDDKGRIREIHNNYRRISFNFGPTLLEWMERHDPDGYRSILEADRLSCLDHAGHGNALAQVYNHAILPLGTERDRRTQIEWGIRDFELRFGRRPEGMWLAETAINMDTVVSLIESGIRFTVLAPTQAERIRVLAGDAWTDVSNNDIDTSRPYRIFPLDAEGEPLCAGHLDVFFYHGSISAAIGFEHLLRDSHQFLGRLKGAYRPEDPVPQLVNVATDGESYGHHEPFGDMALAYLLETLCPREGIETINYGRFLALHPPRHEVRLKNAHSEGTAWSCAHGTGRWSRDCGCSSGGRDGWNQAWRTPLREAMSLLRDHAESAWDALAPQFLRDSWEARWDLPRMRHSLVEREQFLKAHLRPDNGSKAHSDFLRLAELVRMGQFALTSCGWFFDDISGIEPVQNLRYARRACELLRELGRPDPEPAILAILEKAVSCFNGWSGARIWERWVVPPHDPIARLAAHAAFDQLLHGEEGPIPLHGRMLHLSLAPLPSGALQGWVTVYDPEFEEHHGFAALAWKDFDDAPKVRLARTDALPAVESPTRLPSLWSAKALKAWGTEELHLSDLSIDKRREWGEVHSRNALAALLETYERLADKSRPVLSDLSALGLDAPDFLRIPERVVLEARLSAFVESALAAPEPSEVRNARDLLEQARKLGVSGRLWLPAAKLETALRRSLGQILSENDPAASQAVLVLLDLADGAGFPLDKSSIENVANRLRLERLHPALRGPALDAAAKEEARGWIETLERLNFDCDTERDILGSLP